MKTKEKKQLSLSAKSKILATVLSIFFILISVFAMIVTTGTNKTFLYLDIITPIEKRQLEFGVDSEGFSYIKNDDDTKPIRVLQLADIHLACSMIFARRDIMAINAISQIVQNTKPDIIVLTGDNIYPSPFKAMSIDNSLMAKSLAKMFEAFQIPWALVYGNHDAEDYAVWNKTQLSNYFSSLKYCLFQRGPENITGQGNYFIKVLSQNGELVSALSLLDSNSYISPMQYDRIHDDQIEFYKNTLSTLKNSSGQIVPSYMFIHIPLNEYELAWEKYINGDQDVKYHFGIKDWWRICDPAIKGNMFDAIVELGSTKAVFCGHDHTNTFCVEYQGVKLTYGMSIDCLAYFGIFKQKKQRGGTVIDISMQDGLATIKQVPQTNGYMIVE